MTEPAGQPRFELRRTWEFPRERLYQAWTEPDILREWLAPDPATVALAEAKPVEEGPWLIIMRAPDGAEFRVSGQYLAVEPLERLVFTWRWAHEPAETESKVTVTFTEEAPGRTAMHLVHENLASEEAKIGHIEGWESCLAKLESALAVRA
jgi:uncharacterized protein YndB with AHSA1/START domain